MIYTPGSDPSEAASDLSRTFGAFPGAEERMREILSTHMHYCPMLRFTLIDENERLFCADRWCFRGAIDDWFPLAASKPLKALAGKYLPHLNRKSFLELF